MKKVFFALTLSFFSLQTFAQTTERNFKVELTREATFAQGEDGLYTLIFNQLKYTEEARKNKLETEAMLSFNVNVDSTVTQIKILKDPGYTVGDSLKAIMSRLKYLPALENGVPYKSNVMLNVPVRAH